MKVSPLLKKTAPFLPVLLFFWMVLAMYLTLFPAEFITTAAKLGNPKLGHVILFGGWTFLFGITMMIYFEKPRISLFLVVLAGIVFGGFVELLQYLMPYDRTGSPADVGFNTIGAVAAGAALFFLRKKIEPKPDSE